MIDSHPRTPVDLKNSGGARPWVMLVVDDDPTVHDAIRLIIGKMTFRNRPVQMHSAYSTAEALGLLRHISDVAIILLNMAMDSDETGLRLVRAIRDDLGNRTSRIILRTGQSGQRPDERVIVDYDIGDSLARSELTTQKLFPALVTGLRCYQNIVALETTRQGLEAILESADTLMTLPSMRQFAAGVLEQLGSLIGAVGDGILCADIVDKDAGPGPHCGIKVLAGNGSFRDCSDCTLDNTCRHQTVLPLIRQCLTEQRSLFTDDHAILFIDGVTTRAGVALIHGGGTLDDGDRRLIEMFVRKVSSGFQNVILHENLEHLVEQRTTQLASANRELERLATYDPLTELLNRRAFIARAATEIARSRRYQRPLALLALDIDHFKSVNDTHGHATGDQALREVAGCIQSVLRGNDLSARFGGEEFAILLPETQVGAAAEVAERLRLRIAALSIPTGNGPLTITTSIGVTTLMPGDDGLDRLMARADACLYAAKHGGRNRVVRE